MKHYYLYVTAGTCVDADSRFYKVAIGESQREMQVYAWLESYAMEHGHFFAIWNSASIEFCQKLLNSVGKFLDDLRIIDGHELRLCLQIGDEVPATYFANMNRHRMLKAVDPNYYASCQIEIRKRG